MVMGRKPLASRRFFCRHSRNIFQVFFSFEMIPCTPPREHHAERPRRALAIYRAYLSPCNSFSTSCLISCMHGF